MKRKFGFQLNISSKSENQALRDSLEARAPTSPSEYISRRQLSSAVEAKLKEACTSIVRQNRPDSAELKRSDVEHVLKLEGLHRPRPVDPLPLPLPAWANNSKHIRKNASDSPDQSNPIPPSKSTDSKGNVYAYKPEAALKDIIASDAQRIDQTNTVRRRQWPESDSDPASKREPPQLQTRNLRQAKSQGFDRSKGEPRSESSDDSYSTPITASTDFQFNKTSGSTAPTSAGFTPARASHGETQILGIDKVSAAKPEISAAEWMRSQFDLRRRGPSEDRPRPDHTSQNQTSRPSSKRSFKEEIRDYIRPRTSNGSKTFDQQASEKGRSSEDSRATGSSSQFYSPTANGWKSWSVQRKTSREILRGGRTGVNDVQEGINLNRELPPLPRCDTWEEVEAEKKTIKNHIATLIRPITGGSNSKTSTNSTPFFPNGASAVVSGRATPQTRPSGLSRQKTDESWKTLDSSHRMRTMTSKDELHYMAQASSGTNGNFDNREYFQIRSKSSKDDLRSLPTLPSMPPSSPFQATSLANTQPTFTSQDLATTNDSTIDSSKPDDDSRSSSQSRTMSFHSAYSAAGAYANGTFYIPPSTEANSIATRDRSASNANTYRSSSDVPRSTYLPTNRHSFDGSVLDTVASREEEAGGSDEQGQDGQGDEDFEWEGEGDEEPETAPTTTTTHAEPWNSKENIPSNRKKENMNITALPSIPLGTRPIHTPTNKKIIQVTALPDVPTSPTAATQILASLPGPLQEKSPAEKGFKGFFSAAKKGAGEKKSGGGKKAGKKAKVKETWMDRIERNGIKGGILVVGEDVGEAGAPAPTVR
ncbi:hypothetical protein K402DRAFT_417033 [Aulographum hederae CBS 113979]|uniref:Uncharacterized protein n=1 Tax=Aulographum hederae CBS 113979 TaxID=1176131 RepID=A0A6G1HDD8_9PEZI|nr:hypothetical protein K402DRAFT_417033 [Aulographum hederae CBS 113979]